MGSCRNGSVNFNFGVHERNSLGKFKTNIWSTLNKLRCMGFNANFNRNRATIYLSKQSIPKTVRDIQTVLKIFLLKKSNQ